MNTDEHHQMEVRLDRMEAMLQSIHQCLMGDMSDPSRPGLLSTCQRRGDTALQAREKIAALEVQVADLANWKRQALAWIAGAAAVFVIAWEVGKELWTRK